jgi:hypothetical protein
MIFLMASVIVITDVSPMAKCGDTATSTATLPTGAYAADTTQPVCELSVNQNPVGVGQYVLVNAWLTPAVLATRAVKTFIFTVTDPDGKNTTWNQDSENATAATWFTYTLTTPGTYTFSVHFTGCYFNGSTAAGSAMYLPATAKPINVTCQENLNPSWPAAQIPTGYWTRPVDFSKREWWPILGNYPDFYDGTTDPQWSTRYPDTNPYWSSQYDFTPWVQSPHSAHIVWMELDYATAGVTGGQEGINGNTIASDLSTSTMLCNLVYAGRGYRTVTKPEPTNVNGTTILQPVSVWECFDLRTGQVYWDLQGMQIPTFIEYSISVTTAAGSEDAVTCTLDYLAAGTVNATSGALTAPGRLVKYNPTTGAVTANISLDLGGTYTHYLNQYVLTVQNLGSLNANAVGGQYRLINWTISGTSTTFSTRVASNTSYAVSALPSCIDWQSGLGATTTSITAASGIMNAVNVTGFDLYTGKTLWTHLLANYTMFSSSCSVADHGKIAMNMQVINGQAGAYVAYDLKTGNLAWTSPTMDSPWSALGFGAYGVSSAYGLIIHDGYSGITAINWTDGSIAWVYHMYALAPFESPYTDANGTEVYSFNSGNKIADGTIYAYNCEHTTTFPRTRGWSMCAVNITNGEEEWSIALPGNAAFGNAPDIGAIADGYLTMMSDLGYMVTYGIGQSSTTVTAPDTVVPMGTGVVIKGTVMDQSPAQPNTPCVSHDSMTTQMEYLHLQYPVNGLWQNETAVGVPVTLTAIGSDGSVYNLGSVTTNGYYGTYAFTWTPPKADSYTITASFAGDDSYGSSSAGTDLTVGVAPATATPQPTAAATVLPPIEMYFAASTIAIIIAIAIIGLLILRKR